MAWQDRPYYRDRSDTPWGRWSWIVFGSVPLFTAFGVRVRAHAFLLIYVALILALGYGPGFVFGDRIVSLVILFGLVLAHEFGHCFAARWVGGEADQIVLHPLGGLALASPPRRPLPTFLTVAAGPAVNLLVCLICGAILYRAVGWLPTNPLGPRPLPRAFHWGDAVRYVYWIYFTSYVLLMFNLLPIYPLDGGQMVQAALWPWVGYGRSMLFSCTVGMVACGAGMVWAVLSRDLWMAVLWMSLLATNYVRRRQLVELGPDEWGDGVDYSAAYEPATPRRRRKGKLATWAGRRAVARARRASQEARLEQERLDAILAKVSAAGLASLTWRERRELRRATESRRRRDLELSK